MACGVWRVTCGVWRVACGVWRDGNRQVLWKRASTLEAEALLQESRDMCQRAAAMQAEAMAILDDIKTAQVGAARRCVRLTWHMTFRTRAGGRQ